MPVIEYDFYDPADPTTLLGTLDDTQLKSMEFRPALYELGAGSLKVSRHLAAASTDLLRKDNMVFVRVPEISEDPIWGWVIKDGDAALVSKKEQGGENLSYTGPGLLYMLSWARLREDWFAPGQPQRGSAQIDGQWTWHNEPYGAILTRIMEEGQNQPGTPLAHISVDFDREEDSLGNAWSIIPEEFIVRIGEDVLSIAQKLATGGELYLELGPDLVLHAYQSVPGRDLTGSFGAGNVRFEKGVNIATELTRKTRRSAVTHLVTRDRDGVFDHHVIPGFSGQAKYGFTEIDFTNSPGEIDKIAQQTLVSSATEAEEFALEVTPGDDEAAGLYLPGPSGSGGHYWVGDQVTVHTGTGEHDLNATTQRVIGIRITLDEASDASTSARAHRSLHTVPELAYRSQPVYAWGGGQGVLDPTTASPGCCNSGVCTGPYVTGGGTLLDFDWETGPSYQETIPAIGGLSQPAITISSGGGSWPSGVPYRYSTSLPAANAGAYVWSVVSPGDSIAVNVRHRYAGSLLTPRTGMLAIEWVSGSYDAGLGAAAWTTISRVKVEFAMSKDFLWQGLVGTAPGGAVGFRLIDDDGTGPGAGYAGWHLDAIQVFSEGVAIDCPPNSAAAHGHTHAELHSVHMAEDLETAETDTDLVLAPDGSGGVEWASAGAGSHPDASAHDAMGLATDAELAAHTGDTSDAHDASAISILDSANDFTATDVEGALAELQSDAESHAASAHITDHGALSGLADDDHPQYVTDAEHAAIDHGAIAGVSDWTVQMVMDANQDVTNSAAYTDANQWRPIAGGTPGAQVYALAANKIYLIDFLWIVSASNTTADMKIRFIFPTLSRAQKAHGALWHLSTTGADTFLSSQIAGSVQTTWPGAGVAMDPGGTLDDRHTIRGSLTISTDGMSAGDLKVQFAQNAATAAHTARLHAGSLVRIKVIA